VALDAFHRDWQELMPAAASRVATQQTAPDPEQLRPALREMYAEQLAEFPEQVRQPLLDAHVSDEWLRGERTNLVALADELRAGPDIPDVPVVALTAEGVDPGPRLQMSEQTLRAIREGMRRMAAALTSAVSHGEHRTVPDAGHDPLCFTHPDVVVQAIRDVLDRAAGA
jgi:hypothetical protein